MSLKKDLQSLRLQKRLELDRLHRTYVHTRRDVKRTVKRTLSPDRFIRKHLGASMGIAAVLGMFAAPRPSKPVRDEKPAKKSAGAGFFSGLFKSLVTQLQKTFKKDATAEKVAGTIADRAGRKGLNLGTFLELFLPLLVGKLDLTRIITQLVQRYSRKPSRHQGNGHSPEMSVADAGTVKPQDFENFQ